MVVVEFRGCGLRPADRARPRVREVGMVFGSVEGVVIGRPRRRVRGVARRVLPALFLTGLLLPGGSALARPIASSQAPVGTVAQLAQAGLPDCVVPDLRGKTVPEIEYHEVVDGRRVGYTAYACRLGAVRTLHAGRQAHGQPLVVVSESPRPGVAVPYGTAVSLVVDPARRPRNPRPCHLLAGSEAVARFPDILVYRTATDVPDGPKNHILAVTWRACVRASGARPTIYVGDPSDTLSHFVVGGLHVAFTHDSLTRGGDVYRSIVLVDLTTGGQSRFNVPGVGISPGPYPPSLGNPPPLDDVTATVLNAKGFIAWVISDATGNGLYVHDSQGTRLLDRSGGVAITNLRLSADTLTWANGGTPRAATLA